MSGFQHFQEEKIDPTGKNQLTVGYRSRALVDGSLKYNGFVFPPALHSRITIVPEYDNSTRVLKFITIAINIDFVLTDPKLPIQHVGNPDRLAEGNNPQVDGGKISTESARDVIQLLSRNGGALEFNGLGLGQFRVNTNSTDGTYGHRDVDYGPKPQVTEMEPIGGGAAMKVQWLCTTRITPCPQVAGTLLGTFLQFNYGVSWGIDESGYMVRTIEGSAEVPGIHTPDFNASIIPAERLTVADMPVAQLASLKQYLVRIFPYNVGFRRSWNFRLREDKKTFEFSVTDTEIRSESLYPPGVSNIEMSQNINSSFESQGFTAWTLSFNGRVEVVNSKVAGFSQSDSKKLAWFWIIKLIAARRNRFNSIAQFVNQGTVPDASTQPSPEYFDFGQDMPNPQIDMMIYPLYVSVTDEIYSNTIQFTLTYKVVSVSTLLFRAISMFEPMKAENLNDDSCIRYIQETKAHDEAMTPFPDKDIIIDLCHPLSQAAAFFEPKTRPKSQSEEQDPFKITGLEEGRDILDYKNVMDYETIHKTVHGTRITPSGGPSNENFTPVSGRDVPDSPGPDDNIPAPYPYGPQASMSSKNCTISHPIDAESYITMRGYGARLGSPLAAPVVVSVGGRTARHANASHAGPDIESVRVFPTGMRDKDNNPLNIYVTKWRKSYIIDGNPASAKVKTNAIPQRFIS